jgi:hypothetical protein
VVDAAAVGDSALLERAQPGRRLARVEQPRAAAGRLDRPHGAGGERRDARQPPEEVERGPLRGQQRARRALDAEHRRGRLAPLALGAEPLGRDVGVEPPEDSLGDAEPGDHPGRLLRDRRDAAGIGGDGDLRGHVAGADVLGERAVDQLVVQLGGIYGHCDRMLAARNKTRFRGVAWQVTATARLDRFAGAAGLGYVVCAGVENMELLRAPLPGAAASDIRAAYADQALVAVTCVAGILSLLLYAAFAVALAPRLRHPRAALVGGIGGPLLALAAIAASAPLMLHGGAGMTDSGVESAFELQQTLRMLAGPLMALFLFSLGSRAARWVALPLALTPAAAAIGAPALHVAALIAFGLHALVIWLASLWLAAGGGAAARAVVVRRAAFLMLVVAAGLVGIALLIVPGSTATFFAWQLAPESLAAFAGGVYVGSAALYAAGLRASWREARALVAAAVVLSVSVLAITLVHLEKFDLGRLQAWAWLVLFAGFALTTSALLVAGRRPERDGTPLPGATRALLAAVAAALTAVGVGLWVDPAGLAPLGGRFAGSWTVTLGFLAGWGAVADRWEEARLPAMALIALPAGALLGAVRATDADPAYAGGLLLLIACGAGVLRQAASASRS